MPLVNITGTAQATRHAKTMIVQAEYAKGKSFLGAAILLRQRACSEADEYVFRHLLCQAIELILKSVLLTVNYDRFQPQLATKLGHRLLKIADEVCAVCGIAPLRAPIAKELHLLDQVFSTHRLRYASALDVLVSPESIHYRKTMHRLAALVRVIERNGGIVLALEKLSHP